MKYWLVCCNSGHVGRKKSGELALAIEAPDGVTAMLIAKRFPAVKRQRSAYLCTVREIDKEEYLMRRQVSAYDKALRFYRSAKIMLSRTGAKHSLHKNKALFR